ncbi:TetR family transcriptional regulator [Maribellus comscasis]|jgi:AcrR family transcriptional regulator|uniref:TetR family transcriptional regulator n=1 Tax=Maribellus comscasis TaxID=2681766 RepID=A0A6I6K8P1_9BACT|nr:TetR/AcrR family transcriptional regulator [Maribellus comscasis]QGY46424.1 TetR family transcriptional regulator [Maribellus comscasis]
MNTKDFIIDESFKLFLTHSYEGVSINHLSNAICMTKGTLYHHFKSKEELFKLVVDKYLYIPTFNIDAKTNSLYKFIQQGNIQAEKKLLFYFKDNKVFTPLDYFSFLADIFRHYPDFAKKKKKFVNVEIEKITFILHKAIKIREIREDINVPLIATSFFSMNMGLLSNPFSENSIEESILILREQNFEFYKLLKRS